VWRRAQSCLIYNGSSVVGEVPNCPEANLIEIAAYSYNNKSIPFQHVGTLLKEFNTTVQAEVWYNYTIVLEGTQTLFTIATANGTVLETQSIEHWDCEDTNHGNYLTFYFGGVCPAPQEVGLCYSD